MAGDGDGVRRRGPDSGSSEPSQPLQNGSTSEPSAERPLSTTQEALRYEPGVVRVRLTALRDIGAVLRSRYMEHIFRIACVALFLDICWVAWRSHSPTPIRELSSQYRDVTVGDACSWMYDELQWMGPIVLIVVGAFLMRRGKSVYLLDFSLFTPPEGWKVSHEQICDMLRNTGKEEGSFTEQDVEFMTRVLSNSGTGDATAWPPGIVQCLSSGVRQNQSMDSARQEAEDVIGTCMENLFKETGVQPKEVDFLVINCSLFSPTPSLCAMACNKFNMRSSCRTYNLSGQGCSASLLSVDLASELLQNNPNSIAVVVSTELITQSLYHGHEKAMLLQNTLFRCGGAAIMLTNKPRLVGRASYRLRHLVRTQCTDDESYKAVYQCEDGSGCSGIRLSKEIVKVAGNAMKRNLTQLGPLILPFSEQAKVVISIVQRWMRGGSGARYVPSFKSAVNFFCIHAGGRAVLDGIEKSLRLLPEDLGPSRSVLNDRGNTSSSSIWYELRHIEESGKLRRGHKVLQLSFGSGFKCNSAVWTRMR